MDPSLLNMIFTGLAVLIGAIVSAVVTLAAAKRSGKTQDIENLQKGYADLQKGYDMLRQNTTDENQRLNGANLQLAETAKANRADINDLLDERRKLRTELTQLYDSNTTVSKTLIDTKSGCERQIAELQTQVTQQSVQITALTLKLASTLPAAAPATQEAAPAAPIEVVVVNPSVPVHATNNPQARAANG